MALKKEMMQLREFKKGVKEMLDKKNKLLADKDLLIEQLRD
jgi:hypothetical protein